MCGICAVEAGPSCALAGASVWPVNSRLFPSKRKTNHNLVGTGCVYASRVEWRRVQQQGRHSRVGTAPAVCKCSQGWGGGAQAVGTGFMPFMCVCDSLTFVHYSLLTGVLWQRRVPWLSRSCRSLLLSSCTEPLQQPKQAGSPAVGHSGLGSIQHACMSHFVVQQAMGLKQQGLSAAMAGTMR